MYCSVSDVESELYLPVLKQMQTAWGAGYETAVLAQIETAECYIDSMLAGSFETPFRFQRPEEIPKALRVCCQKFAAFGIVARFSEKEDIVADKRADAESMLMAFLSSGRIPGMPDDGKGGDTKGKIRWKSSQEVFTDKEFEKW